MLLFFNMGGWEIIIVVGAVYLLFGPKKIPEIARQLGKIVNEFRRATDDIKREIKKETNKIEHDLKVDVDTSTETKSTVSKPEAAEEKTTPETPEEPPKNQPEKTQPRS